jgi:hypothetical protein
MTLVSKLLGYLVQHVRNRNIERVHPTWIAAALENETHQIAAIILNRFSPEYRKQILQNFTKTHLLTAGYAPPQSAEAIFHIFSGRFASMSAPWGESQLTLKTLYLLKQEEMFVYLRHLGVREIARASSIAGKNALAALVMRFPPELQEDFLNGIKLASGEGPEKQKLAAKRLSQIDLASMSMEEATLRVGLSKLGAGLKQDKETAVKIAQRLPRGLGVILLEAREEMEAGNEEDPELLSILRDLIQKEKIDRQQVDSLFSSVARARPSGIN